jgi:hypothetical protein
MLPGDSTFVRFYSVAGLHERLREHAAHFPDTIDQRFGAWAQLLALFRLVHDGTRHGDPIELPARRGGLFDPDRFLFLEGRTGAGSRQVHERIEPPLVPDGTIYRALEKLLVLDGERISYRALDVEQIGSVYETMMGFRLKTTSGRSLAVRPAKKRGAPSMVDLDALLEVEPGKRAKWVQDRTDRKLTAKVAAAVKETKSHEDLHSALLPVADLAASPDLVPAGAMALQPSEERRRSGSHYTPRTLTEPIVRETLAPVLDRLRGEDGRPPRPEQILELKVCDPAMGSGAFLVEACRQLGDALVDAWAAHGGRPEIPADEDEVILARRLVAHRCLYGVDRNPVAVDLAKMSLWLVTLAREHALTFVDHALRDGDSLVGLSRRQIQAFHWDASAQGFEAVRIGQHLDRVRELRAAIREAGEDVTDAALRDMWDEAQFELDRVRLFGDLVVLAHFSGTKTSERETARAAFAHAVSEGEADALRSRIEERREADPPLLSFHWEVEFPEVFERENGGFDAIVGNPPYMGGTRISNTLGKPYLDYLTAMTPMTTGNVDLAAFFARRVDSLLRIDGCMGVITTNSIRAGDSGRASLGLLLQSERELLVEPREEQWPGDSANVAYLPLALRKRASRLSAPQAPAVLHANVGLCNRGCDVFGAGFVLSDDERNEMLMADPASAPVVQPYIGGQEFNNSPLLQPDRHIINFREMPINEAKRYVLAFRRVSDLVRPARQSVRQRDRRELWWLYATRAPSVYRFLEGHARVLAIAQISKHLAFAFLPRGWVFSNTLLLFLDDRFPFFSVVQSRVHATWVVKWAGAMRQDIRYTSTDCFETFPFPEGWESDPTLEAAGKAYYELRTQLMVANDEGMTKTYNRFHDPDERDPGLLKLRELHAAMDRAVLAAYGWTDIPTDCDFFLDYEDEEEESTRRKKPWRYRWPDDVRDELLARLIELNAQRAAAVERSGAAAAANGSRAKRAPIAAAQAEGLF